MQLNAAQYTLLNELNTRFKAYVGGYGSGKSFIGTVYLFSFIAKHPGQDVGYFGISYGSITDVFFPTARKVAEMLGFQVKILLQKKHVEIYRNGIFYGRIICKSMDNPGSIVGFNITCAMIDEIDTMPIKKAEEAWNNIVARGRERVEGVNNTFVVTTTPEGYSFVYEKFYKAPTKSYSMVQASTLENALHLDDEYIDSLYETYTAEQAKAYINGEFVNLTSGTVYSCYDRERCRSFESVFMGDKKKRMSPEPIFVGMDFNVRRMAASIYVRRNNGKDWHLVDEIVDEYDTRTISETLRDKYPDNPITVYPDASGQRGDTRSGKGAAVSDIAILQDEYKFKVKARKANPRVKDRYTSVNTALEKGRMFVNDNTAPESALCLEQQPFDDNGVPDKDCGKDHQNDATGYPIVYEMPVRKPIRQIQVNFNG